MIITVLCGTRLFSAVYLPVQSAGSDKFSGLKCVEHLDLLEHLLTGAEAIEWISKAFTDDSALLKHELAYCLGQMQDRRAIPILTAVLKDTKQEPMVRHEAGKTWYGDETTFCQIRGIEFVNHLLIISWY